MTATRTTTVPTEQFVGYTQVLVFVRCAGVAELADARDSKSRALHWACGFDPHLRHSNIIFVINHLQEARLPCTRC